MNSYPLGEKKAKDSELFIYFDKKTLDFKQAVIRANTLNITNQILIHAVQPVTERYFAPNDLDFKGVTCTNATQSDQDRLNYYVDRIVDIIFNT